MEETATNLLNPETPADNTTHFTNAEGRSYEIKITVGVAMKLKAELGLDLFAEADGSMFQRLSEEPMRICELLWFLVKGQAIKHYQAAQSEAEITTEEPAKLEELAAEMFWHALDETALDAATIAFFESLIAFFQEGKRKPLRLILQKMQKAEMARNANRVALAESDKVDRLLEAMLTKDLKKAEAFMDQVLAENSGPNTGGP